MNIKNVKALRRLIAKLPTKACYMPSWQENFKNAKAAVKRAETTKSIHSCATVGCLGGWAEAIANPEGVKKWTKARVFLGLSSAQAYRLFYRWPSSIEDDKETTKTWMLKRLDAIIQTGRVSNIPRT